MVQRFLRIALLAAALLADAPPALGQEGKGFYAGVGAATLDYSGRLAGVPFGGTARGAEVLGGYRTSDTLRVELAYRRFAPIERHDVAGSGTQRLDLEADIDTVLVKGIFEFALGDFLGWRRNFRLLAAAGGYRTREDSSSSVRGTQQRTRARDEETGLLFGVGAAYRLRAVDLRGHVDWIGVDGRNEAWNAAIGVQFHF